MSTFLSLVLRHRPEVLGVRLDPAGWVEIEALVAAARARGRLLTRELVEDVVATSPKRRFELSADKRRIRATYGHSVPVNLGLTPAAPPDTLFHGTVRSRLPSILQQGLLPQARLYVHLSEDVATARQVGRRHGRDVVVLAVDAGRMADNGWQFYHPAPTIWLTNHVPPNDLQVVNDDEQPDT
nr:RNA 2'-phosphotransferase [Ardenticatena sp.]